MVETVAKRKVGWLILAILGGCAGFVVFYGVRHRPLIARAPTPTEESAIAEHVLSWLRHELHQSWITDGPFIPDGTHFWGTTYVLEIHVTSEASMMEKSPVLLGECMYGDLQEGAVIVDLGPGRRYAFDKATDQFKRDEPPTSMDRSATRSVHLYIYTAIQ